MPLSHNMAEVSMAISAKLQQEKGRIGLKDVVYGATDLIPEHPAVVVLNSGMERAIKATHKFSLDMQFDLYVVVCKIGSPEDKEESVLALLHSVVDTLAEDRSLGGLVIFSYATSMAVEDITARSVAYRGGSIRFTAMSEENF